MEPPYSGPPDIVNAVVNSAGTSLVLTYNKPIDPAFVPAVALGGALLAAATGAAIVSGSTVTQALAPGVVVGEVGLTVTTTGAQIRDLDGTLVAHLTGYAVANSSARERSPLDVAGLVGWWDPKDPATITHSGGVVTGFTSKVSGAALNPVGSPGYLAAGINGNPATDATGTSYFTSTEAAVVAPGIDAAPRSYLAVAGFDVAGTADMLISWGNSGVSSTRTFYYGQGTVSGGRMTLACLNDAGGGPSALNGTIQTDTAAHVYALVFSGATAASWIDNVADIPSTAFAPGTLTANRLGFDARVDLNPDSFNDGRHGERLLYNRAINATERTYLSVYLKAKWGTP